MKKYLSILLVAIMVVTLTACGSSDKKDSNSNTNTDSNNSSNVSNENSNKEDSLKSIDDFEKSLSDLGIKFEKTETFAQMAGAKTGNKYISENKALEIYQYEKSSDSYKNAEKNQKITVEGFGDFEAIVKNGYALIIDKDYPHYDEIIALFNKLK